MAKSSPRLSSSGSAHARRPGANPGRVRRGQAPPSKSRSRRSRPGLVAAVAAAVVLVVVGALVAVKLSGGTSPATAAAAAPSDVVQATTHVPAATLARVGLGSPTAVVPPKAIKGPPLTAGGRPEVLYVGAEYCPFCAAERWPLVAALSRFGTFSGLMTTESSTTDRFPGTQTFSFAGSHYTSRYLSFVPVEHCTNQPDPANTACSGYTTLERLTAQQAKLLATYDKPPYVSAQSSGGIPFVDFANRYMVSGASYSPQILQSLALGTIAGSLSDPTSPPAQAIDAAANYLTAALCQITANEPGRVCSSPVVHTAEATLGNG